MRDGKGSTFLPADLRQTLREEFERMRITDRDIRRAVTMLVEVAYAEGHAEAYAGGYADGDADREAEQATVTVDRLSIEATRTAWPAGATALDSPRGG